MDLGIMKMKKTIVLSGMDEKDFVGKAFEANMNVLQEARQHEYLSKLLFRYIIEYIENPVKEKNVKVVFDDKERFCKVLLIEDDAFNLRYLVDRPNFIISRNDESADELMVYMSSACTERLCEAIDGFQRRNEMRELEVICGKIMGDEL